MAQLVAVSPARHSHLRWRRFSSYTFARGFIFAHAVAAELPKAALAMPLAFVYQEHHEDEKETAGYFPVALMGVNSGQNMFIDRQGRWLGRYVPAALRGYPFRLFNANGKSVLCVDEDSDLITEDSEGELFFQEDGTIAPSLLTVLEFLQHIEKNRRQTITACTVLEQYELIQSWPINIKTAHHEPHLLEGLYCINETALKQLDGAALQQLMACGALPITYCQLLSMQQVDMLAQLSAQNVKTPPSSTFTLEDDGLLHFN
jgi:hypothetical protein